MKNVRVFYARDFSLRYISHLDMTRFMARAIRRAKLPVWYTEGFHPHLYMTFAQPLPLGFCSDYEAVDLRVLDDALTEEAIQTALQGALPRGMTVLSVAEPVRKCGAVAFADFSVSFEDGGALRCDLEKFLASDKIEVTKKTKRAEATVNLKEKIIFAVLNDSGNTVLTLRLPAGSSENINPQLLLDAFFERHSVYFSPTVVRKMLLDEKQEQFR